MVKDLPSNAGEMGSVPGQETKIPHAMGQISLHAGTTEPTGHDWREAFTSQERPLVPQLRPNTAKNRCEYFKNKLPTQMEMLD